MGPAANGNGVARTAMELRGTSRLSNGMAWLGKDWQRRGMAKQRNATQ